MANLSTLKEKIRSTTDLLKITKAMELVATSKLKKISKKASNITDYIDKTYDVFHNIILNSEKSIYLENKEKKEEEKTLWILVDSNLGMCGGYNSQNNKKLAQNIKNNDFVYVIGGKGVGYCNRNKYEIWDKYLDLDVTFDLKKSTIISKKILDGYINNEFSNVKLIFQHFVNNLTTESKILDILPIKNDEEKDSKSLIYEFEPSADEILTRSVNLYLNSLIYGTFIESQLSEFSSRKNAMESANKNGKEINDDLHLEYNRKRQEKITQEITEIIAGANSLEK